MNDLARVVLEITGDNPADIMLEPEGFVSIWRHRSHVLPGFITVTMRSENSHPKLPPPHQFYIDLSGLRSQYYPCLENDHRQLTHTWVTRQSGITIAHGVATSESLNGYGQRLPSDDTLKFTPGKTGQTAATAPANPPPKPAFLSSLTSEILYL